MKPTGPNPVAEALTTLASGTLAVPVSAVGGIAANLTSGKFGTQEGIQTAENAAKNIQGAMTYQPKTQQGQNYIQQLQSAFEASKLPPIIPEAAGFAPLAGPAAAEARGVARDVTGQLLSPSSVAKPGPVDIAAMQQQFAAKKAGLTPTSIAPNETVGLGSAGAAASKTDPYANKITGEESARGGQFPQIKLSKISQDVPQSEQAVRAQIANEILGDSGQIRPGVVTGNENTLRNEHTLAKMPDATPEGQVYKQQIANEQNALSNYAQERVKATGADPSLIDDEQRGRAVNDVFYGNHPDDPVPTSITGYFQRAKEQIFQSAKDRFGNNPIQTSNVDNLLNNPQWTAGLEIKGNQGVASSAQKFLNLAKNVGFEDASGVMQPAGSVSAYREVRKALNSEWSPQNSRAIAAVNSAIDKDIASAADPSLYKLADNIHKLEKTIFESKGIADIFAPKDKNGVTLSSVPVEKILSKLNNLPIEQWRHIHDTLNQFASGSLRDAPEGMPSIPPELQNAASAAQKEIAGALARKVYESGASKIGTWNQNSVNSTLNSTIGQKILQTFPQDEVAKFHTLNRGGYLMPGVHSYEGAALQQKRVGNLAGTLAEKGLTAGGAGLGGAFFGPPGAAAGAGIGQQVGGKVAGALEQRALSKRATKAVEEMQKAAALNKTLLKDIGK